MAGARLAPCKMRVCLYKGPVSAARRAMKHAPDTV